MLTSIICSLSSTSFSFKNIFKHLEIRLQPFIRHASWVTQSVKHLPAMQETWVQFLGQEDPLEKEMATHSSILAWRIPQRSLAGYSLWDPKSWTWLSAIFFFFPISSNLNRMTQDTCWILMPRVPDLTSHLQGIFAHNLNWTQVTQ